MELIVFISILTDLFLLVGGGRLLLGMARYAGSAV